MKQRILLIEDDPYLGTVLAQKLQHEGYDVAVEQDGGEGLKKIKETHPDLVLLDIILPTMNGYEILEACRKDAACARIPVVVVSNSGQPVEINRALALGIKDYLVKAQMDPEDVVAKVRAHLAPPGANAGAPAASLRGKKILCVEDDSFLGDLIVAKLAQQGCAIRLARDGEHALSMLEADVPDLVLLDLILPGMSGFDVLQKIKSDDRFKRIPVIVLSNLGQQQDVERVEKLGASKHIIKADHDLDDIVREVAGVVSGAAE